MDEFRDYVEDNHLKSGSSDLATYYQNARADARAAYTGNTTRWSSGAGNNDWYDDLHYNFKDPEVYDQEKIMACGRNNPACYNKARITK